MALCWKPAVESYIESNEPPPPHLYESKGHPSHTGQAVQREVKKLELAKFREQIS